jgi:hypothetical protein
MKWTKRQRLALARDGLLLTIGLALILVDVIRGEV